MPRKCTVCAHTKRSAIDKALVARQILATLVESQDVEVGVLKKGEATGPALTVYRPVWGG